TNQYSNVIVDLGFRNIFCVNEKNGKLEWGAIPKKSEALGGVPIIYDNKVFVPHMNGICVYDADTGKLLGVDENIEGSALCFNQLYGSTMITSRESDEYPNGQIIALDLRRQ
ncbi:MAG: PQQ-like beta-propeller repeat protein, partial [Treponema sp.]|nr:PQQ-like beta-propeller repeat protein [Treponema sp.]